MTKLGRLAPQLRMRLGVSGQRLTTGNWAELQRSFTAKEVLDFANLSGDLNPLHIDAEIAKSSIFGKQIVHGMLTGSLFSTLFASHLPNSIYLSQDFRFKAPTYLDETIIARLGVRQVRTRSDRSRIVLCDTILYRSTNQELLLTGEASVLVTAESDE